MNAITILKNDHQDLIEIMAKLEFAADKGAKVDELFQDFKRYFNQHDKAEDEIIYPVFKDIPEFKKLINKGYQAHHIVQVALLELRLIPFASESWAPKFSVLRDSILVHMEEEENILFPMVEEKVSDEILNRLGNKIWQQRSEV